MSVQNENDYRNTKLCPKLNNINEKKRSLKDKIFMEHPQAKIIYNFVSDKKQTYINDFIEIYNHKCAYCGILDKIVNINNFEVDHFVCESSFLKSDSKDKMSREEKTLRKAEAGKIGNLVLSCKLCNRSKRDYFIDEEHRTILNPDDGSIARVFYRDSDYSIKIQQQYKDDTVILDFYNKLFLGNEYKRLDYLLLEAIRLAENTKTTKPNISAKLNEIVGELMQKRNIIPEKLYKV